MSILTNWDSSKLNILTFKNSEIKDKKSNNSSLNSINANKHSSLPNKKIKTNLFLFKTTKLLSKCSKINSKTKDKEEPNSKILMEISSIMRDKKWNQELMSCHDKIRNLKKSSKIKTLSLCNFNKKVSKNLSKWKSISMTQRENS